MMRRLMNPLDGIAEICRAVMSGGLSEANCPNWTVAQSWTGVVNSLANRIQS